MKDGSISAAAIVSASLDLSMIFSRDTQCMAWYDKHILGVSLQLHHLCYRRSVHRLGYLFYFLADCPSDTSICTFFVWRMLTWNFMVGIVEDVLSYDRLPWVLVWPLSSSFVVHSQCIGSAHVISNILKLPVTRIPEEKVIQSRAEKEHLAWEMIIHYQEKLL